MCVGSMQLIISERSPEELMLKAEIEAKQGEIVAAEAVLAALRPELEPLEQKEKLGTLTEAEERRLAWLSDAKKHHYRIVEQLREQKVELLKRQNRAPTKELKLDLVPLERNLQEQGLHMVAPLEVRLPAVPECEPAFCAEEGCDSGPKWTGCS